MDELIVKYLTDKLNVAERELFAYRLENEAGFRDGLRLATVALSIADFSLDAAQQVDMPDFSDELCENEAK